MHTGYAGSEGYDVVDVNFSEEELSDLRSKAAEAMDELAYDMAVENADMYGLSELEGDEGEDYVPNDAVGGSWEIFNLEEHGAYLSPATLEQVRREL